MPDYLLVELAKGPGWDHDKTRREQDGWDEHAAFMDELVEDGVILLGGPVGDVEGELTVHVVTITDEDAVRARFAEDPWSPDKLVIHSVRPWTVWLRPPR
jgi:uncharacterized protein YciI